MLSYKYCHTNTTPVLIPFMFSLRPTTHTLYSPSRSLLSFFFSFSFFFFV
jgi:hypothetical protein